MFIQLEVLVVGVAATIVGSIMDAKDFWTHLEYRVCREIDSLRKNEYRGLWCDGFIPEQFEFCDGQPVLTGSVWMGRGGRHQEQWRFVFLLPKGVTSEVDVNWEAIFPAEEVTGWLSLDQVAREMKVNPAEGHPAGEAVAQKH